MEGDVAVVLTLKGRGTSTVTTGKTPRDPTHKGVHKNSILFFFILVASGRTSLISFLRSVSLRSPREELSAFIIRKILLQAR